MDKCIPKEWIYTSIIVIFPRFALLVFMTELKIYNILVNQYKYNIVL